MSTDSNFLEPRELQDSVSKVRLRQSMSRPSSKPATMASKLFASFLRLPATTRTLFSAAPSLSSSILARRSFTTTPTFNATYNQVLRGCRTEQRARKPTSPALVDRPEMKGVCLRVGTTKPKKPNSGERKVARVRLSSGKVITAYIPGEGHNVQQHSVVLVRGGRSQDCPGVKYHLVRGAFDLVSISIREAGVVWSGFAVLMAVCVGWCW
jgi:small subunit ribosomal protein S12